MTYPTDATPSVVLFELQDGAFNPTGQATPAADGTYSFGPLDVGQYRIGFYDDRDEPAYRSQFYNNVVTDDPQDAAITTLSLTTAPVTGINGGIGLLTLTDVPTPKIVGDKYVGGEISADLGDWESEDVAIAYGWIRNGVELSVEDDYLELEAKDLGAKFVLKIYTQADGYVEATRTSAEITIARGKLGAATPKITGSPKVGSTLKAVVGKWDTKKVKFTYKWLANGKVIKKATTSKFVVPAKYKGKKITVKVTGKKTAYVTSSKVSKAKKIK
jgi:hypothetical protein